MKYRHSHPINILEHTSRFLILLFLPILRAVWELLQETPDFYEWLAGAWMDLVTCLCILALGTIAWYRYEYCFTDTGIDMRKGLFLVKRRFLPYRKLSVVSVEHPFYLRPFGAVRVAADTDGGTFNREDFKATMHQEDVILFLQQTSLPFTDLSEMKRVYLPKNIYIAILSFISSNSLAGVLFVSTLISGAGKLLGEWFEEMLMDQITTLLRILAFGIPPAAAGLAFLILGGWLVSFLQNLIRHLRFSVTRQGEQLQIQSGLITRREYRVMIQRINLIELRQSLITKIFGFYSAFIHANGYGKRKDELSVLMPSCEKEDLSLNIQLLLPEIPFCTPTVRPKLKYLSRFLMPPLCWIGGVAAAWALAVRFFGSYSDLIHYIGVMMEIPCVWYLLVRIVSFFHTGVGEREDAYTFRYTYGYRIKTVAVPKKRIVKVSVRRDPFQIMTGCCKLVILTYSEGLKRHVIPNLDYEEVKRIMGYQRYCK